MVKCAVFSGVCADSRMVVTKDAFIRGGGISHRKCPMREQGSYFTLPNEVFRLETRRR